MSTVVPNHEPYSFDGDQVGILVLHGFTGSPHGLRDWAESFAQAGHTVRMPLLAGHGTTWQDLNSTTWDDWLASCEQAYSELTDRCSHIMVCGLSMGGALALAMAQRHPEILALALVNPAIASADPRLAALPVLKYVVPSLAAVGNDIKAEGVQEFAYSRTPLKALHSFVSQWPQLRAKLPDVSCPVLLFRSPEDHVVPPISAKVILDGIGSEEVEEVLCHNSYHVATLDNDAPMIFARSKEFFASVLARHL